MDMATLNILIQVVIAAFDDASKLVVRIRDQRKNGDRALPEEPTRDLLDSLALGPVIVRGHFDHDFRRFGEPYACGDIQARESMKDVLINLQMTLIIALRSSGMDDVDLDFDALQTASDDCRVNAGVCLGQLSQRLSDAAKAQAMYPPNSMGYSKRSGLVSRTAPSLAYSSSRSTHSSNYAPRTPSDGLSERFATMSVATARPHTGRKMTVGSTESEAQSQPHVGRPVPQRAEPSDNSMFGGLPIQGGYADTEATDALSMRRPSSHTLGPEDKDIASHADSPPPKNPARSPLGQDAEPESFVSSVEEGQTGSSLESSRIPSSLQSVSSRGRYGPEDYTPVADGRQFNYGTTYDMYRLASSNQSPPASYSIRAPEGNQGTLEHIRFLQQNARPPRQGINHFPMPPTAPPRQAPPAIPSFQTRKDSLNRSPSRKAETTIDQLSQFPYPKSSTASQQKQNFQPPLSRLNTRPSISAPIPVHTQQSPPRPPPPPIPRAPTNHSNSSLSPPPQAPGPDVHHLTHTPSTHSNNSTSQTGPSPQTSNHTLQFARPHTPPSFLLARPGTALSIIPTNVPLSLPTDKTPLGFCKCSARLFLSPTSDPKQSKSFSVANRPVGFNSMVPYWSCQKCNFEGPLCTIVNVADEGKKKKKGKEEKIFDPKVRVSIGGGVRYRWV